MIIQRQSGFFEVYKYQKMSYTLPVHVHLLYDFDYSIWHIYRWFMNRLLCAPYCKANLFAWLDVKYFANCLTKWWVTTNIISLRILHILSCTSNGSSKNERWLGRIWRWVQDYSLLHILSTSTKLFNVYVSLFCKKMELKIK